MRTWTQPTLCNMIHGKGLRFLKHFSFMVEHCHSGLSNKTASVETHDLRSALKYPRLPSTTLFFSLLWSQHKIYRCPKEPSSLCIPDVLDLMATGCVACQNPGSFAACRLWSRFLSLRRRVQTDDSFSIPSPWNWHGDQYVDQNKSRRVRVLWAVYCRNLARCSSLPSRSERAYPAPGNPHGIFHLFFPSNDRCHGRREQRTISRELFSHRAIPHRGTCIGYILQ